MKKGFALVLVLSLLAMAAACCAEAPVFETLSGLEWSFCSGVGAWSTELLILADGSFTGRYHDSEMGESADEYPDGTVYFCSFSGRMSLVGQPDSNTWEIRVDELNKDPAEESIGDGTRYVPSEPYGLSEGDVMLLYAPGTPAASLSEEMQLWAHLLDQETPPPELEEWFLCSEANDSGFVGYPQASVADPWEEMTPEQLAEVSGLRFGIPESADNVVFRYLRSEGLAEMQFSLDSSEFHARVQPLAQESGEPADISGMYFDWVNEEAVQIHGCYGTVRQARDGDEGQAELCLWYDAVRGLQYSLSVYTADTDGLDLAALAEQIYIP